MPEGKAFQQQLQRIETLIHEIETFADPSIQASAKEAIQAIMDLHGVVLERMLDLVTQLGEPGDAIIDSLARDELVGGLLLLYGLHPLDLETRVRQALDKVRPYLRSHGGNVELLGIAEGVIQLRLQGSCHGCPSSAMTLKLAIEEGIYAAAPDVVAIEVEGVVERPASPLPGFIPLEPVASANHPPRSNGVGWTHIDGVASLARGSARTIDVSGRPVLICKVDETLYAYDDSCPACGRTLNTARLDATALVCGTCGQHYDVLRAGRGLDEPNLHLEPFPLLVERGQVKVALPAF